MYKYRIDAKVDENQPLIVEELIKRGYSVEVGHDDILVGYKGRTYWVEIKSENCVSKKTGKILESKIKDSQKTIREKWKGYYIIASSCEEIIDSINKDQDKRSKNENIW